MRPVALSVYDCARPPARPPAPLSSRMDVIDLVFVHCTLKVLLLVAAKVWKDVYVKAITGTVTTWQAEFRVIDTLNVFVAVTAPAGPARASSPASTSSRLRFMSFFPQRRRALGDLLKEVRRIPSLRSG